MSISVVIPAFNRADSIVPAVESALAQGPEVSEVIVVDDASADDTVARVQAAYGADPRVKVIALEKNGGGGHARNVGIDVATGDLLAFLDSDDTWHAGKLAKQMVATRGLTNFLCFTNLEVDSGDGAAPTPWNTHVWTEGSTVRQYVLELNQAIQTSTWLMPTEAARKVRFDGSLRRHQDIDFVLRAADAGLNFVYVSETLVSYSADPKAPRTSQRKNAKPSLHWMEQASAYLPEKDIAAFYLKHVFDIEFADAPLRALGRCLGHAMKGHNPISSTLNVVARNVIPPSVKTQLKRLVGKEATA